MKSNQHRPALRLCPLALALGLAFGSAGASAQTLFSAPWYGNADMTPYSENHVEFGLGQLGQYDGGGAGIGGGWTGLNDTGYKLFGNVVAGNRDDATGNYWGLSGFNLGLSSAMVNAEAGKQGSWWLKGAYQGISKVAAQGALIQYTTGTNQNLVGGPNDWYATDVESRRSTYQLAGGFGFLGNWNTFVDYGLTQRSGNQFAGSYAVRNKSIAPIDDETQRMKIGADYAGEALQAEVAYTFSRYTNNVGASYMVGSNVLSVAPDNDWNQISAKAGYSFDRKTRLTGSIGYSWNSQNETFADAANGTFTTDGKGGLNKVNSLDANIKQTVADLAFTTRIANAVGLRASYQFLDRNNETPSLYYAYSGHEGNTLTPSWTSNKFKVDGDYSLMRRTKLRAWYQYEGKDYKPTNQTLRDSLTTNQAGVELSARGNEYVTGLLRYQFDTRSGSEYKSRGIQDWLLVNAGNRWGAPTLRQFWKADYDQNLIRGQLNINPTEVLAVQLRADWRDRDYSGMTCGGTYDTTQGGSSAGSIVTIKDATCLGLTDAQRQTYTLDTQWTASDALQMFGFYTLGKQSQSQLGNDWSSNVVESTKAWWTNTDAIDHTIGLGANFKLNERWDFGGQYNWVKTTTKYDQGIGGVASANPYPDDKTTENTLQVFANWKFKANTSVRLNYVYSHVKGADWAYDGFGDGLGDANWQYTNGLRSPNGADQLVYLSLNVRFK